MKHTVWEKNLVENPCACKRYYLDSVSSLLKHRVTNTYCQLSYFRQQQQQQQQRQERQQQVYLQTIITHESTMT